MQATIGCLSRIVSRTLVNNVVNGKEASSTSGSNLSPQPSRTLTHSASAQAVSASEVAEDHDTGHDHARLLTAVSGFPKTKGSYNIDHILKVICGKDFKVARNVLLSFRLCMKPHNNKP